MPRSRIERIREKIRLREYDMSAHAMEEMAEDELDVIDVETAIGNGRISRSEKDDPRGTKICRGRDCPRPAKISGNRGALHRHWALSDHHSLRNQP